ncbi:putative transcription factor OFP family [Rosa chinensis]|uniref:Transcription repressor n=1 Tax=Rosa chinensis TaxID=74649 RepID=A0A2P6RJF0_ROSCH|nr:transcription repressor OFP8 [Rosa chinensis]PRQ46562.1 putative transcription factor OFP family [Rosa chinensis]
MENRFKLKLSRMFHKASLGTCRSRSISDVIQKTDHSPPKPAPPPPPKPFPSICRPKCSDDQKQQPINRSCVISRSNTDLMLPRRKIFERRSPFVKPEIPPNSLFSHSNPFYEVHESHSFRQRKKKATKKKKKKTRSKKTDLFAISSSSLDSNHFYNGWWSSSEDEEKEDETDTLFSSNTHTSDSSGSRRRLRSSSQRKGQSFGRRRGGSEVGLMPLQGKVKDSFAVVKKSSDPYNDFRTSMVEMIVEKQIFSGKDLDHLLQCFLKLNSPHHHRVIIEVFTEIWEALFSNLGT